GVVNGVDEFKILALSILCIHFISEFAIDHTSVTGTGGEYVLVTGTYRNSSTRMTTRVLGDRVDDAVVRVRTIQCRRWAQNYLYPLNVFFDHSIVNTSRKAGTAWQHGVTAVGELEHLHVEGIVKATGVDTDTGHTRAHHFHALYLVE